VVEGSPEEGGAFLFVLPIALKKKENEIDEHKIQK
jgi:hypothetical protein